MRRVTNEQDLELVQLRRAVAVKHYLTVEEMISRSHERRFVNARREFALEAQRRHYSLPVIGRYLGLRHHTTILSLTRRSDIRVRKADPVAKP